MGRLLQILVTSWTYRPEDVEKTWPRLCALAWPAAPKAAPTQSKKGVLELVQALDDGLLFGEWSKEAKTALEPTLALAKDCKRRLEKALADWQPREANQLSDRLEDLLSELEPLAPPVPED